MKNNIWQSLLTLINSISKKVPSQTEQKPQKVAQSDILDIAEEVAVVEVKVNLEEKVLYINAEKGLNIRETPQVKEGNKIKMLMFGDRVEVIDKKEDWFKVNCVDGTQGWVSIYYLTEENPEESTSEEKRNLSKLSKELPVFEVGRPNLAEDENTKKVRKIINDEFGGRANGWDLQCTEYVHYKVKIELGVDIKWPNSRPRHGGRWAKIFENHDKFKVLDEPKAGCAMSFANPGFNPPYGHVAYVEKVFDDHSIRISEANWPPPGKYFERTLSIQEWKDKYGGKFIEFNNS